MEKRKMESIMRVMKELTGKEEAELREKMKEELRNMELEVSAMKVILEGGKKEQEVAKPKPKPKAKAAGKKKAEEEAAAKKAEEEAAAAKKAEEEAAAKKAEEEGKGGVAHGLVIGAARLHKRRHCFRSEDLGERYVLHATSSSPGSGDSSSSA